MGLRPAPRLSHRGAASGGEPLVSTQPTARLHRHLRAGHEREREPGCVPREYGKAALRGDRSGRRLADVSAALQAHRLAHRRDGGSCGPARGSRLSPVRELLLVHVPAASPAAGAALAGLAIPRGEQARAPLRLRDRGSGDIADAEPVPPRLGGARLLGTRALGRATARVEGDAAHPDRTRSGAVAAPPVLATQEPGGVRALRLCELEWLQPQDPAARGSSPGSRPLLHQRIG